MSILVFNLVGGDKFRWEWNDIGRKIFITFIPPFIQI